MGKKEILQDNLLIAKFMGYPYYLENCFRYHGGPIEGSTTHYDAVISKVKLDTYESYGDVHIRNSGFVPVDLNNWYHNSWDKLMSVRSEIEGMGFRFSLFSCEEHCEVEFTDMAIPGNSIVKIKSYDYKDIIEVVYEAIIAFIIWYKNNPDKSLNHE